VLLLCFFKKMISRLIELNSFWHAGGTSAFWMMFHDCNSVAGHGCHTSNVYIDVSLPVLLSLSKNNSYSGSWENTGESLLAVKTILLMQAVFSSLCSTLRGGTSGLLFSLVWCTVNLSSNPEWVSVMRFDHINHWDTSAHEHCTAVTIIVSVGLKCPLIQIHHQKTSPEPIAIKACCQSPCRAGQ